MTTTPIFTGIDLLNDRATIVKLRTDSGRPEVTEWKTIELAELPDFCVEHPNAHIALPDTLINVHSITASYPAGVDSMSAVAFEIRQSMLSDGNEFLVDVLTGANSKRHLGLVVRREQLADYYREKCNLMLGNDNQFSFSSRVVSQVHGWLEFCNQVDGEFIAYMDISNSQISVALVYRRLIVDIFVMPFNLTTTSLEDDLQHSLTEFKTILDFHLASLFDSGITLPLTSQVISGCDATKALLSALSNLVEMPLERPKINSGYFLQAEMPDQPLESSVLTALGLASLIACNSNPGNVS